MQRQGSVSPMYVLDSVGVYEILCSKVKSEPIHRSFIGPNMCIRTYYICN